MSIFGLFIRFQGGSSQYGPTCRPVTDPDPEVYSQYDNACDTLGWVQVDDSGDEYKYAPNYPYFMRLTKVQSSSVPLHC